VGRSIPWGSFVIFSILMIVPASLFFTPIFSRDDNGGHLQPIIKSIPLLASAREAFEKGYADGLVTIRPEVGTVAIKLGESVMVKFFITYERRKPAPEVVELRFGLGKSGMYIRRDEKSNPADLRTNLRVNDYMRYKPEVVKIREDETAEAWVIIYFAEDILRALIYNEWLPKREMYPPIDVDIFQNYPRHIIVVEVAPLEVVFEVAP